MIIETDRVRSESYTYSTKAKANADVILEYQKVVEEKMVELSERLRGGNDQVSYQIGAQSFTEREWNKLIEEYDYAQDELKKLMRERHAELDKKDQITENAKEYRQKEEIAEEKIGKLLKDKNEVLLDSEAIFSICHAPTGETAYVYRAENYSDDNPVYIVKGKDINGDNYEEEINVNAINTNNCSYIEILAWTAHTKHVTPEEYIKICRMLHNSDGASYLDKIDYTEVVRKLMEEAKSVGEVTTYLEYVELLKELKK